MDRRQFITGACATLTGVIAGSAYASEQGKDASSMSSTTDSERDSDLIMWYPRPAREWLEALPIGNGRLGAMVFGGVEKEQFQLNEHSVWAGSPHDYDSPDAFEALPEIRRLVFEGQWQRAQNLVNEKFVGRPVIQAQYQPVGDLSLDFESGNVTWYRRELDLQRSLVTVEYDAGGVRFRRETFASFPDDIIVTRITADKPGAIDCRISFSSPQHVETSVRGVDTLVSNGVAGNAASSPGSIRFQLLAKAVAEGGKTEAIEDSVHVSGANALTILVSVGSSYHDWQDATGRDLDLVQKCLIAASRKSYGEMRAAHIEDFQRLFGRFAIDLGRRPGLSERPTDQRVAAFAEDGDPSLAALYCQYGRYLLISSSRKGLFPANLQGLWNASMDPPWGSKYTININTEMNYFPAGPCNLLDCYEPLFNMVCLMTVPGAKTAKTHYGANGWLAHHNTDAWLGTAPVDGAFWGMWPTGGAWLCKSFADYYDYTGDVNALSWHYPVIQAASAFFLETLVEEPKHGWLVTCPSISPENAHHPDASICAGPTCDTAIVRDLFDSCIRASEILGVDRDFRDRVAQARARLAPFQVSHDGRLQEWLEDWDSIAPEQTHRHVSHLYALHPSNQVSKRETPDLFEAAKRSLLARGDESTGWAMAWRINFWARFEDGDHAYKLLHGLLHPERTAPNMFDLHPPFQIDGNFGGAAGIVEMLVQSQNGEIHLLPALPSVWLSGTVRGVLARGGFEVDLTWEDGKPTRIAILSKLGNPCNVRHGERVVRFGTASGQRLVLDRELKAV
jgi:alpha-L-fucosidase 2